MIPTRAISSITVQHCRSSRPRSITVNAQCTTVFQRPRASAKKSRLFVAAFSLDGYTRLPFSSRKTTAVGKMSISLCHIAEHKLHTFVTRVLRQALILVGHRETVHIEGRKHALQCDTSAQCHNAVGKGEKHIEREKRDCEQA